jgi:hypothetical protein
MAYWTTVILMAQLALIPCEGRLRGVFIPNILQVALPLALLIAAVSFIVAKRSGRIIVADFLPVALGLWGLLGIFLMPGKDLSKWYGNRFLYPMGFYYLVRLIPLDRASVAKALNLNLAAAALQSLLVVTYRWTGINPFYPPPKLFNNVRALPGPFDSPYTLAPYLAPWVPLLVYSALTAKSPRGRLLAFSGLVLTLLAITCTTQRAATMAALIGIAFLFVARKLRLPMIKMLLIMALLYVPLSTKKIVSTVSVRTKETDQSRDVYKRVGWEIVRSPYWDPLLGVGFNRAREVSPKLTIDDDSTEFNLWGTRIMTAADVAERGVVLHNIYLSFLVEFGIVGAALGAGIILALFFSLGRLYLAQRKDPGVDFSMATAIAAGIVVILAVGKYHNIYIMHATMSIFWFLYGILVGRPEALCTAQEVFVKQESTTGEVPWTKAFRLTPAELGKGLPRGPMSQPWDPSLGRLRHVKHGSRSGTKDDVEGSTR